MSPVPLDHDGIGRPVRTRGRHARGECERKDRDRDPGGMNEYLPQDPLLLAPLLQKGRDDARPGRGICTQGLPRRVIGSLTTTEGVRWESKLAAQGAVEKVAKLARDEGEDELVQVLERMQQEAAATEERCTEVAGELDGKKTAILDFA